METSIKKLKLEGAVVILLILGSGCGKPYGLGPLPPPVPTFTPTPTATITPGCQTTGLNTLTGGGMYTAFTGFILPTGTPTPTPTPSWSWTGAVPPHPGGITLIQTTADWNAFVASSYLPGSSLPIPFNPATQALVVMGSEGWCPNYFTVTSICNNGSQVTVQIDENQSCCPVLIYMPGVLQRTLFQAVIVEKFGLPVILNHIYHSWVGPLCL